MTAPAAVVCPACGHQFIPDAGATRATEAVEADNPKKPYGDVNYADPGYQKDGKARYPLDTEQHVRAAWSYINQSDNAAQYTSDQLKNIKGRIRAAAKRFGIAIADQATEAGTVTDSDRLAGRVIEAKGTGSDGGRIFRVRVIAYGDSKNARRYPEAVMRAAAPLYEGVKAYDHHRAEGELRSSTISGLVGYYRNAEATGDGIEADLHLLPSATRAAVDSAHVGGEPSTESTGTAKASFMGKFMIRQMVADAGLPESAVEAVTALLPEQVTEADLSTQIAALKTSLGLVERTGLTPTNTAAVTREAVDKKRDALDAFFAGDYVNGYRSFREAFADFTGRRPKSFDEDYNRVILRESLGEYDSGVTRSTESMDSTTWNLVLGDSITRRMVAEYVQPSLQTWRQVVSSTPPVNDFRIQRIERVGGYGVLPAVNQGAPYQPLTSPTNEEVTYTLTKRGGTEDITLEMIANDDIRAIQRIPGKLGLAAAQTLYRFVWDILPTNAATSYDATALFAVGHANTDNPAVGSVFNADKVTYKIRHIYSGTVLDHRGFYRGSN